MSTISKIQAESNWGTEANKINQNFTNLNTDIVKLQNTAGIKIPLFSSVSAATASITSPYEGQLILVGSTLPAPVYRWNGSSWANTGTTGGSASTPLTDFYTKEEVIALQNEKLSISNLSSERGKSTTTAMTQAAVTQELETQDEKLTELSSDSIVRSSRITAIKNPTLNPELPIEFAGIGNTVKIEDADLPTPLRNVGLNYFFSKTKEAKNLELYPQVLPENAILPTGNQYVRISYIIWNIDNPIIGVSTSYSRSRLFLFTPTQVIVSPINVNISKLADKTYKVDLFYKLPDVTITKFWLEIICETDNIIPTGRTVYLGGINIAYSDDIALALDNELAMSQAIAALELGRKAATKEEINALIALISSKFTINSVIEGGNLDPIKDLSILSSLVYKNDNEYLNDLGITKIGTSIKKSSGNVECYAVFNTAKKQEYFENSGKYIKVKWLIFSKNGVMCTTSATNRLGIIGISDAVSYINGKVTYKQVDAQVFEVTATWLINQTTLPSFIYLCSVWEADIVPEDWVVGDLGITGFGVWYADTLAGLNDELLQYDWIDNPNSLLTLEQGDKRYALKTDVPDTSLTNYNNVEYNQTALAEFLKKYISKEVDAFNQINIALAGDSIFGRVDKSSFTPESAEISLTPDCNNPLEKNYGYVTGHFPPNMWEQIVAYKVLEELQYDDADVKYYNHVASEITKSGTWVDRFPVGADCLRTTTAEAQGSNMILTFSGAGFVKFVYSCYAYHSETRKIQVTISDDNGTSWKTPADLGLTERLKSHSDGSGIYYLPAQKYKFGNIVWGGFDKTKTYKLKVQKIDTAGTLNVWGFETWSNPRVNVIVTAEGGNTASNQVERWDRFYADMYDQDLIIYELPYLNDLGTGVINQYKGEISPSSTPAANPAQYDFYYAKTDGIYTNFDDLSVLAGQYIEWSGTEWTIGSTQVKDKITKYITNNEIVFERLRKIGVPLITLITHDSTSFKNRPFSWGYGLLLLRLMVKKYGLACIDVNRYQKIKSLNNIYSDGTHLNDNGVAMYTEVLKEVFNQDNAFVGLAYPQNNNLPLKGNSSSNSVSFGFEFKEIPTVRLYNTTRTIETVTKSGFTTTGTGQFDWEAILD